MQIKNGIDFRKLYDEHWKMVYSVCCYYLRNEEEAKDLVQDVFRSIWERRESLSVEVKSWEGYLVKAAKLSVFEHIRNKSTRRKHLEITKSQITNVEPTTPEQLLNSSLLAERISDLVNGLPRQCRNVFKLSREEGMSNSEIADLLQISKRAVEYHIHRALCTMRENLNNYKFVSLPFLLILNGLTDL